MPLQGSWRNQRGEVVIPSQGGGKLIARLNRTRPDLFLLALDQGRPTAELLTLKQGELCPASTRGLWLAESFAAQDGWLVREERIRWKDWLAQQSATPQKSPA